MQTIILDGFDTGAQCKDAKHIKGDYVMLMRATGPLYAKVEAITEQQLTLVTVTQTEWEHANSQGNPLATLAAMFAVVVLIALAAGFGVVIATADI